MASPSEKHQALFGALVSSYTSQAMVCLGKLANPITGDVERDLEQASVLIDMLHMLEVRTEGNLTDEEAAALRQSLSMLRLNYVEEVNKPKEAEKPEQPNVSGSAGSEPEDAPSGSPEA